MGLEEALKNIDTLQAELQSLLEPSASSVTEALLALPSPEMMFSDPDHVPRFIDWSEKSVKLNDVDLHLSTSARSGISSSGALFGFDVSSERLDG